ncbi:MAG TPA: hypothetical protein VJ872_16415 [Nocardioides sp.]|nr:hypothetical protein [Nocardioides sp.]
MASLCLVLAIYCLAWLRWAHAPSAIWFVAGFASGALAAATVGLMFVAFLAHEKKGLVHLRGKWGEGNTRDALAKAKRRRHIVGWVDSVQLQYGDLDHVAVTRSGEILLIDSKWRYDGNADSAAQMAHDALRGRQRAEGILRSRLKAERGQHRQRGTATPVTPVVVLWGAAQQGLRTDAEVEGVAFVAGRDLVRWLAHRAQGDADKESALHVLSELEKFRADVVERSTSQRTPQTSGGSSQ